MLPFIAVEPFTERIEQQEDGQPDGVHGREVEAIAFQGGDAGDAVSEEEHGARVVNGDCRGGDGKEMDQIEMRQIVEHGYPAEDDQLFAER